MTAEQMIELKKRITEMGRVVYSYDNDNYDIEISDNKFFELIVWVDNYKKEVK